jgi:hypothetical protein
MAASIESKPVAKGPDDWIRVTSLVTRIESMAVTHDGLAAMNESMEVAKMLPSHAVAE